MTCTVFASKNDRSQTKIGKSEEFKVPQYTLCVISEESSCTDTETHNRKNIAKYVTENVPGNG